MTHPPSADERQAHRPVAAVRVAAGVAACGRVAPGVSDEDAEVDRTCVSH
jgi:hypothetical protein